MKPHKHAELIKAWADGAEIECFTYGGWVYVAHPSWDDDIQHRIKPQPKPTTDQVFYMMTDYGRLRVKFSGGKLLSFEVIE